MSVNHVVASRQSRIAHHLVQREEPGKILSVKSYSVDEANEIITQAASNPKIARRFLNHMNSKRRKGWRLDSFHRQLRELCVTTLANAAPRVVQVNDNVEYLITPHAGTALN